MKITDFWRLQKLSLWCLLLAGLTNCTGQLRGKKIQHLLSTERAEVYLQPARQDSVILTYTGCSGFVIQYRDQIVMHDPFFSNDGPLSLLSIKRLHSDTAAIDRFFANRFSEDGDVEGRTKLLLVSHTHYDHMMDIPYIHRRWLNKDSVSVYGSDDMVKLMKYATADGKTSLQRVFSVEHDVADSVYLPSFYSDNGRVRIVPVISEHAPHYHKAHFYQGHIRRPPTKANHWKEGVNFSFLIDFLDEEGVIRFRMFINSAASGAPENFIAPDVLAAHPVDVAVLCVASYNYVEDYPDHVLQTLQPRHLILTHWENFFKKRTVLKKRPLTVPFTNVPKFMSNLDTLTEQLEKHPGWTLPVLDTDIVIYF